MPRIYNTFVTELEYYNATEILWVLLMLRFFLLLIGILIIIVNIIITHPGIQTTGVVVGIEWGLLIALLGILALSYSKRIIFYWGTRELVIQTKILWKVM